MRQQFPGYYRPSAEQFSSLWSDALVVADTNVLLNLYRFSASAREQLFAILEAVADKLWIPHQVELEFERNRIGVILEQRRQYEVVIKEIEKNRNAVLQRIRRRSAMDQAQLAAKFEEQLQPVIAELTKLSENHPDPIDGDDLLGPDSVRDRLGNLLTGKIGVVADEADLVKVGAKRYAMRVPPGFSDEKKPEPERYGDLAIWQQIMAHAKEQKKDVMLITGDQKEDWWLKVDGQTIGPRPELVAEMRATANASFYMYGLDSFMSEASARLKIETSEETIQEAKDIATEIWPYWIQTARNPTWTNIPLEGLSSQPIPSEFPMTYPLLFESKAETDVFVLPDEAVLTFRPGSSRPANGKVICMIATPSGTELRSVGGTSSGGSVAVRFPADFSPEASVQDGQYVAAWYDVPDDDDEPEMLASAHFEISTEQG